MSTTLEVILKTAGFTEGATAIKKVGDEATNTNNKLKTTTSTVDQVSKSTTSLGSKLANAGKQFSGTITNVAALGSTVVNLSRQYQDLSDTQIRVDRTQLKVSKTAEAVKAAQGKLNALVSQGVKSGAAYEKALLDVQQAQEASTLAVTMNGEALEDQQRAYENFAMTLAPTILTAGSSVTSALKEIGGEKGIGGLVTKLKTLPESLNMSGKSFAGMAGSIGLASIALVELFDQIKRGADIKELQKLNETIGATSETIDKEIAQLKAQKNSWGQALKDFFFAGPIGQKITGMPSGGFVIDEVIKSLESKESRDKGIAAFKNLLISITSMEGDPEVKSHAIATIKNIIAIFTNDSNWKAGYGGTAQQVRDNTVNNFLIPAFKSLETDTRLLPIINQIPTGITGALKDAFLKVNPFAGLMGETLKQAMTMAAGGGISGGLDTITAAMNKPAVEALAKLKTYAADASATLVDVWTVAGPKVAEEMDNAAKASETAAAKIKSDQEAAAAAFKAAWDAAFSAQVSGIDKMLAAYSKLHPKEKGFSILGDERQFNAAQAQLDKLLSGAVTKAPAYAKTFVTNFISQISQNMTPIGAQVFKPIIDYVTAHKNDAPDVFMKGFEETLKNVPTLAGAMAGLLDKGMVQPATAAAETTSKAITTGLGKVDITPLEEKMKLGAQAAGLITKGINKIPKKVNTTVNITANLAQANAKWAAFVRKVQMTTLQVKIAGSSVNIKKGSQAGAYGGPKQHGYQSTVHRPTMFLAGEGGRPEDVTVRPRGSVQRGGSGGGGFYGTVNVYVDGVLRPARYSMGARK